MSRKSNVRNITKFKRSVKAISPVIATLLMIAITVVAALVAYAWVSGYIGGVTTKTGTSIQIQSYAGDTSGNLVVYVQNVGQGGVQLDPAGALYINDGLVQIMLANGLAPGQSISIPEGQTVALSVQPPGYYQGEFVKIKVVTTGGTSALVSGTGTGLSSPRVAGPAASLVVAGYPNPTTVGISHSITVTAVDSQGLTATSYTGTVHFTSTDPAATLPGDSQLTNGVGTFGATFNTAGSRSITATDTVTVTITGVQSGISVTSGGGAGVATHFAVSGFPSPVASGTPGLVTVEALDASNNRATGYSGTVHISSSDGSATLPANGGLSNGLGSFTVTLNTVATQSITATDTVTSSITGTQTGISVTAAGVLTQFVFGSISSPQIVGAPFTVSITAKDQFGATFNYNGNDGVVTDDSGSVSVSGVTFVNGVATPAPSITVASQKTGNILHVSAGTKGGDSNSFDVNLAPAVLNHFTFETISAQTFGNPFSITIHAIDQYGNPFTTYTGTNTLSCVGGTMTETATTAFTAGSWTGSVTVTAGSSVSIHTTAQSDTSKIGDSNSFAVGQAPVNIQFTTNGVGAGTGTSTILIIDSVQYQYSQLNPTPLTLQWVPGTNHQIEAVSPVSGGAGTQYVWTSWSIGGLRQQQYTTPSSPATVTASYGSQYNLKFGQANLDSTAQGTIVSVTIGANPVVNVAFTDLPKDFGYLDSGTNIAYTFTPTVASTTSGEQFVLTTPAPTPASSFSLSGATTVTGTYKAQWQVTFVQSGLSADATGTVVTVGGVAKAYSDFPVNAWVDASTGSLTYTFTNPVTSSVTGKQYALTAPAPTPASPVTGLSGPITVTGTYKIQYQVTFDASANVKGDSSVTIVTAAGISKTGAQLPYTTWYDTSSLTYSYVSPIASSGSPSTSYAWSSISGLGQTLQSNTFTVSGTGTITATYTASQTFGIDSSGSSSSTSSAAITVSPLNCAVGDVAIILASSSSGRSVASISGGGLTWTNRASVDQSGHDRIYEYYAIVTGSPLTTVTVTFSASDSNGLNVVVFGISGANTANPFDGSARTAYSSATGAPTVSGVSTANANDMIIGLEGHRSTTDATAGSIAGTTGTLIKAQHAGASGTAAEDRIVTSTLSSQSVAFGTISTNDWAMIVEAVQKAGTGTVGYTTQGTDGSSDIETNVDGNVFTSPSLAVTVQSINAYISVSASHTVKAAIYSSSNVLLATTQEVTVTTSGWVTLTLTTPYTLAASTNYIVTVAANSASGTCTLAYDAVSGAGYRQDNDYTYASLWPNPFLNWDTSSTGYWFSIYCTYTYP